MTTVWDVLCERARRTPLAPAILAPGRRELTYRALLGQVRSAVHALNDFGFGQGDRIAVVLPPGPECPTALVSAMCGCVCVPLNPEYSVAEFTASFSHSRVAALVTRSLEVPKAALAAKRCGIPTIELEPLAGDEAGRFRLHGESRSPAARGGFSSADELAAVFATSGTTSSPKLIPLTQAVICHRAWRARHIVDLKSSDRCLDLMHSFHGGAMLISILGSLFAGASSACLGVSAAEDFERRIGEIEATWCALPPPFLETLLAKKIRWRDVHPSLRVLFTTGAPVSAETADAIERTFGIPLQSSYGATECGGVAVNPLPPRTRKCGSVGLSFGLEMNVLPSGEIAVRGPGVFSGYESANGAGETAFEGDWYRTGDRGYRDADGYLFLTGRLKELINRGGEKISPEEIEAVLRRHPAIADAAAFPIPHAVLGQDIAALIVTRPGGVDANELRHFAAQSLAAFKIPRAVLSVAAVPLGPAGKVQRNQLASLFAEELAHALKLREDVYDPPRTQVEKMLSEIWARNLKADRIGIRTRFLDAGGDSLLAVNMLTEVERKFGRSVSMGVFWQSPTIENLAALLMAADCKKTSLLLPVQTAGEKPPLFCVLPGWFVPEVELLSRYLGPDQPVFALIPDPRPGAGQSGLTREQIVAECVAAMEGAQREGPYFVIGRSVGGLVAFDIAQALRGEGKSVGLIGLLDAHYPGIARNHLLPTPLRQIEFLIGEFVAMPRAKWLEHARRLPGRALRRTWRRVRRRPLPSQIANATLYTGLQRLFHDEPQPWPGRIILFAAESSKHRGFLDRRLYWSKAADHGLEVHLMPGDHNMMVQEPHIRHFAVALQGCLERARAES